LLSRLIILFLGVATVASASAHEMTPAYPEVKPSHVRDVVKAEMSLFNSREEVEFYEVDLYDKDFNRIPFKTKYTLIRINYKERKNFTVYIRKKDLFRATFICTTSKFRRGTTTRTLVSSRICSRLGGKSI
jgi:hypothetical protein